MYTAVSHNVLDKASINYCFTIIIEATTIYFCKWKNFARLNSYALQNGKYTQTFGNSAEHPATSEKFMCYEPKYPAFFAVE